MVSIHTNVYSMRSLTSLFRHPYLSRMTPATNWHNRIPSFMNGHFSDSTFSPGPDRGWKNILGTFPSLKVGTSMYCSAVLGTEKPQNVVAGKRRLRVYEDENIPGDGRTNPSIYTRVNFDDITGNVYRMRNPDDFSSVFGSYSRSVNQDPLDGITPAMAQQCNLCSAYGAPLSLSPQDQSCKTNNNKFLRYDLTESLYDKHFNEFVENNRLQFLQFEFSNFNLSAGNPDQLDLVEQLLGMKLSGEALPYDKRPCSGNVQTMPAGKVRLRFVFLLHSDPLHLQVFQAYANSRPICLRWSRINVVSNVLFKPPTMVRVV